MLRESMQIAGQPVDLGRVAHGEDEGVAVPHARELLEFAEAVVSREAPRIGAARAELRRALGDAALVDAAAITAAFHGFVRLADATGIPYATAAGGKDRPEIREAAGVHEFYRLRESQ
jgi:alkylhydroperoxidase family enzyme